MIVLQRISDGAVFPYSKKTAGKAGFEVIDDPDRKPYESGKPRKIKPRRTAQRQAQDAIAREFQDFDDNGSG